MRQKLNLAYLKQKKTEIERKDMKTVKGGRPACGCDSECDMGPLSVLAYGDIFGTIYDGTVWGDKKCYCGSIFVAIGLWW